MNAIETFDLTKKFGDLVAVDSVNISVEEGEIFGLLGPNGAGKTTIISILCTMINPTSGAAKVNGFDVVRQPSKVRKSIGIVFQEPSIDDRLTGRENLEFHAVLYGIPRDVRKRRIKDVLSLVELEDRADSLVRTYSGGMRRRLELARGLLHYPKVLFLDEPTLGLDSQTREHIWEYIEDLVQRENITVILTTHYMEEADRLCDRVAIIDFGVIKVLDTPKALKNDLKGAVITIRTKDPKKLATRLSELDIDKVSITRGVLRLNAQDGEKLIPRVITLANDINADIDSISLHEPTLNDVYLHHIGREIRGASAERISGMLAVMRRRMK